MATRARWPLRSTRRPTRRSCFSGAPPSGEPPRTRSCDKVAIAPGRAHRAETAQLPAPGPHLADAKQRDRCEALPEATSSGRRSRLRHFVGAGTAALSLHWSVDLRQERAPLLELAGAHASELELDEPSSTVQQSSMSPLWLPTVRPPLCCAADDGVGENQLIADPFQTRRHCAWELVVGNLE